MASGLFTWLIVSVPIGLCLALWGFGLHRQRHRVGRWLIVWGLSGPYLMPVATGVTLLIAGKSAPSSPDEPWPWYAAVALYSVMFTLVVTVTLMVTGWTSMIARIGLNDGPKQ